MKILAKPALMIPRGNLLEALLLTIDGLSTQTLLIILLWVSSIAL